MAVLLSKEEYFQFNLTAVIQVKVSVCLDETVILAKYGRELIFRQFD